MSLTSLAWISSNDRILWSLVWRILLWAYTQFVQRFSTQSRQRAVAWELSSQLVHLVGFCTASTVSMLLMKKLRGKASIPLAGTGTRSWHIEHWRVRSWDLEVKRNRLRRYCPIMICYHLLIATNGTTYTKFIRWFHFEEESAQGAPFRVSKKPLGNSSAVVADLPITWNNALFAIAAIASIAVHFHEPCYFRGETIGEKHKQN